MPANLPDIERALEELLIAKDGYHDVEFDDFTPVVTKRRREDQILLKKAALLALIAEVVDPGFHDFLSMAKRFLEHYPAGVFTGKSGNCGALFIVRLRQAVEAFEQERLRQEDKKHG